jgi:photosystem II stability/assembly factor-like uncharacterized protein
MNKILYILFAALLISTQSYSQWTWLNPTPQGNYLNHLVKLPDGKLIAVGRYGTIKTSVDNGATWSIKVNVNNVSSEILSLFALNSQIVFAGTFNGILLESSDSGESWHVIFQFPGASNPIKKIYFQNEQMGFLIRSSSELFKTTDGGISWENSYSYGGGGSIEDIYFFNSGTGLICGGILNTASLIRKTTNAGINWFAVNVVQHNVIRNFSFVNSMTGFTSTSNGMFKTTDQGANWNLTTIYDYEGEQLKFLDQNTGYRTSKYSMYAKTINGGQNWSELGSPVYTFNSGGMNSLILGSAGIEYVLTGRHIVLRSTNDGANWSTLTQSLNSYAPFQFVSFVNENTGFVGGWGSMNDYLLFKSTNGGNSWNGVAQGINALSLVYLYDMNMLNSDVGYAVGGKNDKGYILKTTNSGNNWSISDSLGTNRLTRIRFLDQNTGVVFGSFSDAFRTTNGGNSWVQMNGIPSDKTSINFSASNVLYMCSSSSTQKVYRSTDMGNTWTEIYSTSGTTFNNIRFIDQSTGFIAGRGIFKTTNGGASWSQKLQGTLPYVQDIKFVNGSTGFASAEAGRMFKSTDAGETWGELYSISDNYISGFHFFNSNTGFVAGDQGMILKTTNSGGGFVGVGNTHSIVNQYRLGQNYPNPFNPFTLINYSVSESRVVSIIIYDILGREISTLVNQFRNRGEYSVTWDASTFPSGVYFYELRAGDYSERKKMVLVK